VAVFSQRFWGRLVLLDARLMGALRDQREACARLLVGRRVIIGSALGDYHQELRERNLDSQQALSELELFCAVRRGSCARTSRCDAPECPSDRHPFETFAG
jgi:hypothetical protein